MNTKETIANLTKIINQVKDLNLDSESYHSIDTLYNKANHILAQYRPYASKLVADAKFTNGNKENDLDTAANNFDTLIPDTAYDKWNVDTDDEAGSLVLKYINDRGFSDVADSGGEPFKALVQLGQYDADALVMNHYGNEYSSHWTLLTADALVSVVENSIKAVKKFANNFKATKD